MIRASEIVDRKLKSHNWVDEVLGGGLIYGDSYIMYGNYAELIMINYMVSALGKVVYINSTDYYARRNLINAEEIAHAAKARGLDPNQVLDLIIEISAHSSQRLLHAVQLALRMKDVKLMVLHGLNSFKNDLRSSELAFYTLKNMAFMHGVPFLAIGDKSEVTPTMSSMCGHMVDVERAGDAVQFTFLKPKQAQLIVRLNEMGRLTPSFRKRYEDYIEKLRKDFEPLLRDGREKALEDMIKNVWSPETASMSALDMPQVSDAMAFISIVYLMNELSLVKNELNKLKEEMGKDKN